jgi:hypothetical protein
MFACVGRLFQTREDANEMHGRRFYSKPLLVYYRVDFDADPLTAGVIQPLPHRLNDEMLGCLGLRQVGV